MGNTMQKFSSFIESLIEEEILSDPIREAYIAEQYDILLEKLITVGGKAYPKFGNVVIMAGGAGSGKGFVKSNLVGMEGIDIDVDALKQLAAKAPMIKKRVSQEMGIDIEKLAANLKKPENVSKLHGIIGDFLKLDSRRLKATYTSILSAASDRKPNIIFDTTLKDLQKLQNLGRQLTSIGYDKSNIHIVWVVNDIEVAQAQNKKRDRVVPAEILVNTHRGASNTMNDIVNMGKGLKKYMDGDIVFAFNKVGVDSSLVKSDKAGKKIGMKGNTKGGQFIKDAEYFYVKRKGKAPTPSAKLETELRRKIASYVPKGISWDA
jgi:predicted kinase